MLSRLLVLTFSVLLSSLILVPAAITAPSSEPNFWENWTQVDGDEFTNAPVNTQFWGLYDSPGHAGNGLRRPAAISVQDGHLRITGDTNIVSGGMMSQGHDYNRGRWAVRMRLNHSGPGSPYHAVAALIPAGVPYYEGARDLDFAEGDVGSGTIYAFLHYRTPAGNKQDYSPAYLDLTQWHEYVLEVTDTHMTWFVDGVAIFTDLNRLAIPSGYGLEMNLQLDAYSPSGKALTYMDVDYIRYYPIPPGGTPTTPAPPPLVGDYR